MRVERRVGGGKGERCGVASCREVSFVHYNERRGGDGGEYDSRV